MSLHARGGGWNAARKSGRLMAVSAVVCVLLANCLTAVAQFRYRKIADTTMLIPGGTGTFTSFSDVAYDGQNVFLVGNGASG